MINDIGVGQDPLDKTMQDKKKKTYKEVQTEAIRPLKNSLEAQR
jgi:hypothetical protein